MKSFWREKEREIKRNSWTKGFEPFEFWEHVEWHTKIRPSVLHVFDGSNSISMHHVKSNTICGPVASCFRRTHFTITLLKRGPIQIRATLFQSTIWNQIIQFMGLLPCALEEPISTLLFKRGPIQSCEWVKNEKQIKGIWTNTWRRPDSNRRPSVC